MKPKHNKTKCGLETKPIKGDKELKSKCRVCVYLNPLNGDCVLFDIHIGVTPLSMKQKLKNFTGSLVDYANSGFKNRD